MKNSRKYTLSGISIFLLMCFLVTVLPTDAFHNHAMFKNVNTVCKDVKGQKCQHKMHLSTRNSFCWACAVHFDKSFTSQPEFKEPVYSTNLNSIVEATQRFYQASILQHTLRGPPSA